MAVGANGDHGVLVLDLVEQEYNSGQENVITQCKLISKIYILLISVFLCRYIFSKQTFSFLFPGFRPSHGGNFCSGDSEDWQICFSEDCPEPYVDLRDQQCKQLPRLLNMDYIAQNSTWGPYESDFSK